MPTEIVNQLLIDSDNSAGADIPFMLHRNTKDDIFICSQAEDATGWWVVIKKEDWNNIKAFIDDQLK